MEPTYNGDVRITLPVGRACDAPVAPCGSEERRLSNQPEQTISDPNFSNSPACGALGVEVPRRLANRSTHPSQISKDRKGMSGAVFAYMWIHHELRAATDAEMNKATG